MFFVSIVLQKKVAVEASRRTVRFGKMTGDRKKMSESKLKIAQATVALRFVLKFDSKRNRGTGVKVETIQERLTLTREELS